MYTQNQRKVTSPVLRRERSIKPTHTLYPCLPPFFSIQTTYWLLLKQFTTLNRWHSLTWLLKNVVDTGFETDWTRQKTHYIHRPVIETAYFYHIHKPASRYSERLMYPHVWRIALMPLSFCSSYIKQQRIFTSSLGYRKNNVFIF
jgi:hypothetical protein